MATNTIRIDDGVRDETVRIAGEMGLSFNAVVNILLRKFNATQGFPFPVRLEPAANATVFDMNSEDFIAACKEAVANREAHPTAEYVSRIDQDTGKIYKQYADGRVEYVLD